ncbi:N-acetylmuramoyl-L-alanine amidase [Streptosporangium sp. NBC_01755]|uniref:N-acetylmuramoyl-L-alanine amidase n=1 Tax=Streptosporangium sp. NBC_01755 TaxID=2975949 RepID=UPI002DDB255D|nr:N-acetylmuramoyl-L-alanine amidase [Streptosporangium sp. NBC_01755]WSD00668.1 N-acetylmuramoyl-L-alanine amidase [Streptosporangium sp. NBC_01755]
MRRLPGITVVAALTVLVSAVPAQATRPEDRVAWPWKHPAPFTTATSPDAVTDTPSPTGTRARSGRQAAFAEAARAYGVPESVLLAVSYLESRWEGHGGLPSVSAGYGPMHLVDGRARPGRPHGVGEDPRGDETRPRAIALPPVAPPPPQDTLRRASKLTGLPLGRLREDASANIMGGAALLADYRRRTGGSPDTGPAGWYEAVARYPGTPERGAAGTEAARSFADEVYATIQAGAARVTDDGERVVLPAIPDLSTPRAPLTPEPSLPEPSLPEPLAPKAQRRAHGPAPTPTAAPSLGTERAEKPVTEPATKIAAVLPAAPSPLPMARPVARPAASAVAPDVRPAVEPAIGPAVEPAVGPDCPRNVSCEWLPAVYRRLKSGGYGNHDRSDGPRKIDYIVIHDGETSYDAMTRLVKNPDYLSWHFTIRSSDGHIAQHLRARDIGWHAGNWYVNSRSVGLEHEGYLAKGGAWFTEAMYLASARLVRHLAAKYDIPLDRAHILGHDNVPGTTPETVGGMHDDPGPYWDWSHYFELLGSPLRASGGDTARSVLIKPDYGTNSPNFTGCSGGCRSLGAASVWLHTRPSLTAPLVRDIGKHPTGDSTYSVYDHAARASTGQRYALAERRDGWTAIWYLGQKAWFSDPAGAPTSLPASGPLVTPRPGRSPVKVYGRAYPKAHAYPGGVPVQALTPLQYSIPAGQVYSSGPMTTASYLRAAAFDPSEHRVVRGEIRYRQIQFGHRIMFVRASDVQPLRK